MPESFSAYIDESGCTGFKFDHGSSEWFVIAALVVRKKNELCLLDAVQELRKELKLQKQQSFHFSKQKEDQRNSVLRKLGKMPVRVVAVAFHKPSLAGGSFKTVREQMFNYAARLCIERVSWLCANDAGGSKEVELVFSQRKQMSKTQLEAYVRQLKAMGGGSSIKWDSVCPSRIRVASHDSTALLQMADYASSSVRYSFEASKAPESYTDHLSGIFYAHNGTIMRYGLKFLPKFQELQRAGLRCGNLPFA